jgi:hypothetical protein
MDCSVTAPRADTENPATATKLWKISEQIVEAVS